MAFHNLDTSYLSHLLSCCATLGVYALTLIHFIQLLDYTPVLPFTLCHVWNCIPFSFPISIPYWEHLQLRCFFKISFSMKPFYSLQLKLITSSSHLCLSLCITIFLAKKKQFAFLHWTVSSFQTESISYLFITQVFKKFLEDSRCLL